jgi:hypothetical protein
MGKTQSPSPGKDQGNPWSVPQGQSVLPGRDRRFFIFLGAQGRMQDQEKQEDSGGGRPPGFYIFHARISPYFNIHNIPPRGHINRIILSTDYFILFRELIFC